jgi:serine/threonine-protein kinase
MTRSKMMVGTVNYMAPEQLRGEKSDHRADIFSFGVVVYELLSGKKPFQADSFASTMYKILNETPEALDQIDPSLPPHLTAIVDRAIAKSRDDRYQHMTELGRDLATAYEGLRGSDMRVLSHITSMTPPPSRAQSLDHLTSPDAVTIATPLPTLAQTAAALGTPPPTPFPASPSPQPTPSAAPATPSSAETWPQAAGSRRWIYAAAFGIALAALSLLVFRDRSPQPTSAVPTTQAPQPAPAPSPAPVPPPPAAGSERQEFPERPEITGRPEGPERQEPAEGNGAQPPAVPLPAPGATPDVSSRAASEIAAQVARLNRQARAAFEAGRHDEAAQQAREALALDRRNRAASELLARIGAAEREHVATALAAMDSAKAAAVAADARNLVPSLFSAAERQEALAREANTQKDYTAAAARMEAATTLFKTAETGARTELEARAARAQADENRRRAEASRTEAPTVPPPAPAPAPPKPESVPVRPSSPVKPETAVSAVLERYTNALEQRDLGALKAVWPSLSGAQQAAIEAEFSNARSISVQFVNPKIEISGATATVTGTRRYGMQTRDGQQLRTETMTTLVLRQAGNGWQIESVRHQAR